MLCYRCGSYTPDGVQSCEVCGYSFAERKQAAGVRTKTLGNDPKGTPGQVAPYVAGDFIAGRYRVVAPIAQGVAGWVLQARDEDAGIAVAVKIISANLLQTDDERTRFLKVVKKTRKSVHQNLVRIYDEGRDKAYVYYTMPFVEGLTLRKIIDLRLERHHTFNMTEILPLFSQVGAASESIKKFTAHGALRPMRIIVVPDLLKVTGLAHLHGLPSRPFVAAHDAGSSSAYLAPEVRHNTEFDQRADVYSIATMVLEMLTGHVYRRDPTIWTNAGLNPAVATALQRATSEDPKERFTKPSELVAALRNTSNTSVPATTSRNVLTTLPHESSVEIDTPRMRDPDATQEPPVQAALLPPIDDDQHLISLVDTYSGAAPILLKSKMNGMRIKALLMGLALLVLTGTAITGVRWYQQSIQEKEAAPATHTRGQRR